jgi:hypothetical protein
VFAERMYRARVDINGLPQLEAAKLLGFSNSSPLAKIEMGESFARSMPVIAARVYGVTTDYLLGVCDFDFECRAPGTEWEAAIMDANKAFFKVMFQDNAKALASLARSTGVNVDGMAKIMAATGTVKAAFDRMVELNPEVWEGVRGGTRLEAAIQALNKACVDAQRVADRARIELKMDSFKAGILEISADESLFTA